MAFEAVYAHAPGQCFLALSTTHHTLVSGGPDLLLNGFPLSKNGAIDEQEAPRECRPHTNGTSQCLAVSGDVVVSGSSAGEVAVLSLPGLAFDRIAMQFGLGVRAVAVSSGARFIAAGGEYQSPYH
jgi:hypothetical protein